MASTSDDIAVVFSGPAPAAWVAETARATSGAAGQCRFFMDATCPSTPGYLQKKIAALAPFAPATEIRDVTDLDDGVLAHVFDLRGASAGGIPGALILVDENNEIACPLHLVFDAYVRRRVTLNLRIVRSGASATNATLLYDATIPIGRSFAKTVAFILERLPIWFASALNRHRNDLSVGTVPAPVVSDTRSKLRRGPAYLWAFVLAVASYARALFTIEQWNVAFIEMDDPANVLKPLEWSKAEWAPPPAKRTFLADPFLIAATGDSRSIYAEHFDYRTSIGTLEEIRYRRGGEIEARRTVLDSGYHLSYPSLFEDGIETFVLPEMGESGGAHLYWMSGDGHLEFYTTILDEVPLIDGTLFRYEDRIWLFGCRADRDCGIDLFAWYADKLAGPWHEHALNPIKTDIRSSRPAGSVLKLGSEIIRPAQDCSETYGGAVTLNRLDVLTPSRFEETTIASIKPDAASQFHHGMHTLNHRDGVLVVDAKRHVFDIMGPYWHRNIVRHSRQRTKTTE